MNFTQLLLILKARYRIVLFALLVTVSTTLIVSLLLPQSYNATTTLVVDFKGVDPLSGLMQPAQLMPGYIATQTEIIKSHNVALKVVEALKMTQSPVVREQFAEATGGEGDIRDWLADRMLRALEVQPSRESTLIQVEYKGADPQFAATVANAFAQAYIQTNLELRVEPARLTTTWFDAQIKQLRDNLEQAQAKLSAYQKEQGVVASDERIDVETARLAELSSQFVVAQAQTYDSVSRRNQSHEALADVMNNPMVQGLKADLARSEIKLSEMESKFGKNHPQYQRLQTEVDTLRGKLDTEIKTATQTVSTTARLSQQRESDFRGALAAQKARVLSTKQKRDEMSVLLRDVENAQQLFDQATRRNGQTRLESQTTHTDIAVLNPAVPPAKPSSPKILLNLMASLVLGGFLGLGLGFLMEMIDRRIRSEQDLVEALDIPVLGVLSGGESKRRRLPWDKLPGAQPA
ncbi:MAG: chain length determinant protein EpsF [Hydrogenophilales bacterium]|nr:chain length determinant protein EpsF [Hydrogenophilales bacterium]